MRNILGLALVISFGIAANAELSKSEQKRRQDIDKYSEVMTNASLGLMATYIGYKSSHGIADKNPSLGWPKDPIDMKAAYEKEKSYANCLTKARSASLKSPLPIKFYGDSSQLVITEEDGKLQIYTPKGMVTLDGTNCRSADSSKKVSDGLIKIASHLVNKFRGIRGSLAWSHNKLNAAVREFC